MIYFNYTPTEVDSFPIVLFDNKVVGATITASSEDLPDGAKENVATTSTFDFWQPESGTASITFDLGASFLVDTVSIVAHTLGSVSAVVKLESSTDGSTWVEEAEEEPEDNSTITFLIVGKSRRYWRISTVSTDAYVIGNVLIGKKLVFPAGVRPPYTPTDMAENVELLISETLEGQFITNRPLRYGISTEVNLNAVEYGFVEDDLKPFRRHFNDGKPFIWASSPRFLENDTAYVWRRFDGGELRPVFDANGNFMNLSMDLMGYKG
jgi:hypothetical protein